MGDGSALVRPRVWAPFDEIVDPAADCTHGVVTEVLRQHLQPIGLRYGIVVQECDPLGGRPRKPDPHRGDNRRTATNDNDFVGGVCLMSDGVKASLKVSFAPCNCRDHNCHAVRATDARPAVARAHQAARTIIGITTATRALLENFIAWLVPAAPRTEAQV
jgi:hypothetical protein